MWFVCLFRRIENYYHDHDVDHQLHDKDADMTDLNKLIFASIEMEVIPLIIRVMNRNRIIELKCMLSLKHRHRLFH